jgi:hypothetical protein
VNQEHEVFQGVYYIHNELHRNGNPNKSQWTIVEVDERSCFATGFVSWRDREDSCWGLHIVNAGVAYLGVTPIVAPDRRDLFIAKFRDSSLDAKWHGYPVNSGDGSPQDIPPPIVLAAWLQSGLLRAAVVRKIARGQRCIL